MPEVGRTDGAERAGDAPSPDAPSPDAPSPDAPSPDTPSPDTPSPDTRSPDTRSRLLTAALRLFGERGVAGTSLQMIADELGVTKAAVYYHFKTKDEIVAAVLEPLRSEFDPLAEQAAAGRTAGARVDRALAGFVELVVRHRTVSRLLNTDPQMGRVARETADPATLREGHPLIGILTGPDPTPQTLVRTHVALHGLAQAGAAAELSHLDDETLRRHLHETARRLFGRPRATR